MLLLHQFRLQGQGVGPIRGSFQRARQLFTRESCACCPSFAWRAVGGSVDGDKRVWMRMHNSSNRRRYFVVGLHHVSS